MLPNCETIVIVRRDSSKYVLSSDISRVLGLSENTFLSTLEQFCITVKGVWEPSHEVLDRVRSGDGSAEHSSEDVLIPVAAVAGLMRAHIYIEGKSLENEKNVLKAFKRIEEEA